MNKFFKGVKKMANDFQDKIIGVREKTQTRKEEDRKLKDWKIKLDNAKAGYDQARSDMKTFESYYVGTRTPQANPNTGKTVKKQATNVRNIVYELIESQVDSSIPMPKVRAIHAEDDELAKKIERLLENKIKTCHFAEINDFMERTVPVQGGDFFLVEWDSKAGLHSQLGDIKVTEVHPKRFIPQPGCVEVRDMDYFFIQTLMTKAAVKRTYEVDVSDAEDDDNLKEDRENGSYSSDLVTVNTAYYKNDEDGVGIYTWCDNYKLLDIKDYLARHLDRCAECGAVMVDGVCPECGSKKKKDSTEDYEELIDTLTVKVDGQENPMQVPQMVEQPMVDEMGNPVLDMMGQPKMTMKKEKKKVPYYKPNVYPVVLRRNISSQDNLLGQSDVKPIIDQQDTIMKLGTKINEKLLTGGSYVTLPKGVDVEKNEKEFKVIRLDNAAQKQLIDVITLQPNTTTDVTMLETNYQWAKSSLGITDSYQGKYDASARTGTAKQYAINQAAGRLESKRTLKNEAYANLYELMFKFWLAYADTDEEITTVGPGGETDHERLNRHEFLKIDSSGEFYWDDEFIFETDPTSTLMANREAMWAQTDQKLQSQAFGPLGELETLRTYWTFMKASGYPNAGTALDIVEARIAEQKQQAQMEAELMAQQQQEQPMEGEMQDAMPVM